MKKILFFSFVLLSFISCSEDVKFNNPAFQAKRDGENWRAVDYKVSLAANGSLTIEGYTSNELVTMKIPTTTAQTYPLGNSTTKVASYVYTGSNGKIIYTTGVGVGEGEIVIEEYDAANKTISGAFKFNLENTDDDSSEKPIVNFQYGRFYKLPVVSSTTITPVTTSATP